MKAAIYIRVSTERQAEEGFSLEAQRDILMQTLQRKELELYKVYTDPGVSGKSLKRPGVQAMLSDMKAKKFDTILIHKLDRLSRNMGDIIQFIELVNRLDVRLIIVAQGQDEIDTRSPLGKAFIQFNGIWSELYLNNLREETLKGLVKKIQNGGRHMSSAPLGYELDHENNLVIVEEEAAKVREVFNLFVNKGWGVTKIAKHMNETTTTKRGGKWDNKSVRNIVTNPTYAGFNHFKPEHWSEDKRIITNGNHEPIIPLEWYEKTKKMRERRAAGHMSRRAWLYPFGGIVKCGKCGGTYVGYTAGVRSLEGKMYYSYRCLNDYASGTCDAPGISEKILTKLVFKHVMVDMDGIKDPNKANEAQKTKRDILKEIEVSKRRKKNWMLALGDGKLSPEDYSMLVDEEDERIGALQLEIIEEDRLEQEISTEDLKNMIASLQDNWDLFERDTQKELIQSMFRKIVIIKEEDGWKLEQLLTV